MKLQVTNDWIYLAAGKEIEVILQITEKGYFAVVDGVTLVNPLVHETGNFQNSFIPMRLWIKPWINLDR